MPRARREELKGWQNGARAESRGMWGLAHPLEGGNTHAFVYCASTNGKVFHPIDSSTAKRIQAQNFLGYHTRAQAEATGRVLGARYDDEKNK